jgi:hypothetical protein
MRRRTTRRAVIDLLLLWGVTTTSLMRRTTTRRAVIDLLLLWGVAQKKKK